MNVFPVTKESSSGGYSGSVVAASNNVGYGGYTMTGPMRARCVCRLVGCSFEKWNLNGRGRKIEFKCHFVTISRIYICVYIYRLTDTKYA